MHGDIYPTGRETEAVKASRLAMIGQLLELEMEAMEMEAMDMEAMETVVDAALA